MEQRGTIRRSRRLRERGRREKNEGRKFVVDMYTCTTLQNAKTFNGNISKRDVSIVTDMHGMFREAKSLNGDISMWDVSSVTNMMSMFDNE